MFLNVMLAAIIMMPLPKGPTPAPLDFPHFPDRLHTFVWRNWNLVPLERMAEVVGAEAADLDRIGKAMGLPDAARVSDEQMQRTYITIIRRNWHLLPYDQLVQLLGWTEEKLAYTLREDDFLYIKLGSLKPRCEPLRYALPSDAARARQSEIRAVVEQYFGRSPGVSKDPLLSFVHTLSTPVSGSIPAHSSIFNPRFCYSYFALYGDPLLEQDPFPDGYLKRLAQIGVNGVWLHAVLYKLSPFPWDASLSTHWEQRLARLKDLVARAKQHGMGVYLYLNEPRTMPLPFFEAHPELKGVAQSDYAALCTSVPEVRAYISGAVENICRHVPDLAGFFSITASENPTNCWSHNLGGQCPRCASRGPAAVIAEVNATIMDGIQRSGVPACLMAWDWGWGEDWAPDAIAQLPAGTMHMSVSEWHTPFARGGIENTVGEYSISVIGPGPRAMRHWAAARARGLKTIAKIQANTTWELGAVPYIPALYNVAGHIAGLREQHVSGLMLGWTLGGFPSPNLETVYEMGRTGENGKLPSIDEALTRVAQRRYGTEATAVVLQAWRIFSDAFSEFPYDIGVVYNAPLQMGPANLLWEKPTQYRATMVGLPYDDLDSWRSLYPAEVFLSQLAKTASGFDTGADLLAELISGGSIKDPKFEKALQEEISVARAIALHYHSVVNQGRYILLRDQRLIGVETEESQMLSLEIQRVLKNEIEIATRLHDLQVRDSRIGFEATNHYFYTPLDLVEKVLNCVWMLDRLPVQHPQ